MKTTLLALTLTLMTTTAHASIGQWAREVSALVAAETGMTELDSASLYANICGQLDTQYLMYDSKTGETYSLGMNAMPSMESESNLVTLLNIADCKTVTVKVKGL